MSRTRRSPSEPRRPRWPGWVVVAVVSLLAASTLQPRWLGLSERTPWAQLVQLRVAAAGAALATAVVLAVLALFLRLARRRPTRTPVLALVLALVAAGHGGVLVARGAVSSQDDLPADRAGDLTVLALNMEQGGAATDVVVALARRSRADVLMLSEVHPDQGRAIGAGLEGVGQPWTVLCAPTDVPEPKPPNRYSLLPYVEPAACLLVSPGMGPYEVAGPQPDLLGGGVVARPVGPGGTPPPDAGAGARRVQGPPLAVVHTTPPVPLTFGMGEWRREVATAVAVCPSLDGGVVGGDLNASEDAAGLRRLGPCVDAAAGAPAAGTWPSSLPGALGSRIDHVLADGRAWTPVASRTVFVAGTDHRALVSVLRPR